MPDQRKHLNAFVTPEVHEAIHGFARRHGVTASALIEAMGERVRDSYADTPTHELPEGMQQIVERARVIGAERLRGGGAAAT